VSIRTAIKLEIPRSSIAQKKCRPTAVREANNVAFGSNTLRKEILRKHAPKNSVAELSGVYAKLSTGSDNLDNTTAT
jgi:hypothetical protein